MVVRGKKQSVDDGALRALLARYACPIPYHQVRARFMGNIATPDMNASPMKEVQRIWNDDLPEFEDRKEAEAFFGVLLQGMWNGLSAHQKRSDPFKLARIKTAPGKQWAVRREYLKRIKIAFDAAGIEIPFPHMKLVPPGQSMATDRTG